MQWIINGLCIKSQFKLQCHYLLEFIDMDLLMLLEKYFLSEVCDLESYNNIYCACVFAYMCLQLDDYDQIILQVFMKPKANSYIAYFYSCKFSLIYKCCYLVSLFSVLCLMSFSIHFVVRY